MAIPDFVFLNGGKEEDWIPLHDNFDQDGPVHLAHISRERWWYNNYLIRCALKEMRTSVELKLERHTKVNCKDLSLSNLSRVTGLKSDTIRHKRRIGWVEMELSSIRSLVSEKKDSPHQIQSKKDKQLINSLRKLLDNQRQETANWVIKTEKIKVELDLSKRIIENLQAELNRRSSGGARDNSRILKIERKDQ